MATTRNSSIQCKCNHFHQKIVIIIELLWVQFKTRLWVVLFGRRCLFFLFALRLKRQSTFLHYAQLYHCLSLLITAWQNWRIASFQKLFHFLWEISVKDSIINQISYCLLSDQTKIFLCAKHDPRNQFYLSFTDFLPWRFISQEAQKYVLKKGEKMKQVEQSSDNRCVLAIC